MTKGHRKSGEDASRQWGQVGASPEQQADLRSRSTAAQTPWEKMPSTFSARRSLWVMPECAAWNGDNTTPLCKGYLHTSILPLILR